MTRIKKRALGCLCLALVAAHCGAPKPVSKPPQTERVDQNAKMVASILRVAQDGDWLVIRGYKAADRLVAAATHNPLSHAAMIDVQNAQVIESESSGIHVIDLTAFVDKSHRVLLIRPMWAVSDPKVGKKALTNARAAIGGKYDYLGTVGLDNKDRYYCSELILEVYREFFSGKEKIPLVIEPGQLYLWGNVLYDSRPRNEW